MLVVFNLGFRPFFLLGAVFAIILMALWVPGFTGGRALSTYYGQIGWHSHEMIFGYTVGVIAGFLLTAVLRGLLPSIFPLWFSQLVILSGMLWIAAFLIFVIVYAPILTQPRIDAQPG